MAEKEGHVLNVTNATPMGVVNQAAQSSDPLVMISEEGVVQKNRHVPKMETAIHIVCLIIEGEFL